MTEGSPPSQRSSLIIRVFHENRFVLLLGILAALVLLVPILHTFDMQERSPMPRIVTTVLFSLVLLASVFAIQASRLANIMAIVIATPAIMLWIVNIPIQSAVIEIAEYSVGSLFVLFVVAMIVRHLFTTTSVTVNTIAASLCVYLLLGILWAMFYSLVVLNDPGAFLITSEPGADPAVMRFGSRGAAYAVYFSYVTMTTLGYGDIVPISMGAKTLAMMQAVTGQIYLVVLVARLVGMHIAMSSHDSRARD